MTLEGITAVLWVFGTQKCQPRGCPVARERDEEFRVLYFGSSPGGTTSATEITSDTFQTYSRMRQSARRLQYDGTIPKPHV